MNQRTFRSLLLALLLVLSQAVAAAHVLSHIGERSEGGAPIETCKWCVSCHQLGDASPATVLPTAAGVPAAPCPVGATPAKAFPAARLAYRSRAPPRIS